MRTFAGSQKERVDKEAEKEQRRVVWAKGLRMHCKIDLFIPRVAEDFEVVFLSFSLLDK